MSEDTNFPKPKVTGAPDEIWLVYGDIERDCTHQECARDGEVTWCEDSVFESDVKYVRADRLEAAEKDAAYFKWRLLTILPLFQEARDALDAISLASAKLYGVDLSLGYRMDAAGTATRSDFDAALAKEPE